MMSSPPILSSALCSLLTDSVSRATRLGAGSRRGLGLGVTRRAFKGRPTTPPKDSKALSPLNT